MRRWGMECINDDIKDCTTAKVDVNSFDQVQKDILNMCISTHLQEFQNGKMNNDTQRDEDDNNENSEKGKTSYEDNDKMEKNRKKRMVNIKFTDINI
ncbi:hypothetical protein POVCU2_0033150 [Plasmodium ovale curtisi]|uniref:Uncharacterized protein n=1 Tax=Plasmodium ovale curtisi TaxID=864141 RepID=A0A1A8VZ12_PLAOA|nr:hypothetical protein POVCU2_0033150 [Plasmodium ovale curtisi]SBS95947.1 hypothetical protein POVCU1_030390 [Plasmodium ovale curtisi]